MTFDTLLFRGFGTLFMVLGFSSLCDILQYHLNTEYGRFQSYLWCLLVFLDTESFHIYKSGLQVSGRTWLGRETREMDVWKYLQQQKFPSNVRCKVGCRTLREMSKWCSDNVWEAMWFQFSSQLQDCSCRPLTFKPASRRQTQLACPLPLLPYCWVGMKFKWKHLGKFKTFAFVEMTECVHQIKYWCESKFLQNILRKEMRSWGNFYWNLSSVLEVIVTSQVAQEREEIIGLVSKDFTQAGGSTALLQLVSSTLWGLYWRNHFKLKIIELDEEEMAVIQAFGANSFVLLEGIVLGSQALASSATCLASYEFLDPCLLNTEIVWRNTCPLGCSVSWNSAQVYEVSVFHPKHFNIWGFVLKHFIGKVSKFDVQNCEIKVIHTGLVSQ